MVSASSKKEREEIEALKKELAKVQEEAKAREVKLRAQGERLQKQVEDLKAANKEAADELRHVKD